MRACTHKFVRGKRGIDAMEALPQTASQRLITPRVASLHKRSLFRTALVGPVVVLLLSAAAVFLGILCLVDDDDFTSSLAWCRSQSLWGFMVAVGSLSPFFLLFVGGCVARVGARSGRDTSNISRVEIGAPYQIRI